MSFDKIRRAMAVSHLCRDVKGVAVLLHLADQYFEDSKECCPLVDELMEKTTLSRSSVTRALEELEEDHFIAVDRRYGARHYFTLLLDEQLALREGPRPVGRRRDKRSTGFRIRPRPDRESLETHVTQTWVSGRKSDDNRSQPDANRSQAEIGSATDLDHNPRQPDVGSHVTQTQTHVSLTNDSILLPNPGSLQPTAAASPRLPFPIAVKPPRPISETAKLADQHRLQKLRRRVAGYAVGLVLKPERGIELIQEPITSESTLIAATKELCVREGVKGYGDVVGAMCLSVWWRQSDYGKAVIAGGAPRPRDLAQSTRFDRDGRKKR